MYQHIHIHIFFCTFKNKLFSVSNLALSTLRTSTNLAVLSTAFTFPKPTCSRSCKENEKRNSHSNFKVTKTFETFYLSQTTKKNEKNEQTCPRPSSRPTDPSLFENAMVFSFQWTVASTHSIFSSNRLRLASTQMRCKCWKTNVFNTYRLWIILFFFSIPLTSIFDRQSCLSAAIFLVSLCPTPSLLGDDKKNDCGSHCRLFCTVLDEKMSLTSKRKKVKILVHCLDAYSCVIKNLKQKQIK